MAQHRLITPGQIVIPCYLAAATATFSQVGEGAGAFASAGGESLEVVSADPSDAAAGSGAQQVKLLVVLDDGTTSILTGVLNGTTAAAVAGATTVAAVLDAWCTAFGAGGTNAGAITVRKVAAGGDRLKIAAGRKRAAPGHFRVPEGFEFVLQGAHLGFTNVATSTPLAVEAEIEAQVAPDTCAVSPTFTRVGAPAAATHNRPLVWNWPHEEVIPAGAIVRMRALASSASVLAGAFWGRLRRILPTE